MKISYNWLKKFVDLKSIDVVINKLNLSGLEVDGFYKVGDFRGVITAEIKSVEKIEGSDKLLLCKTFVGKETIDVITGDTTVKEGEILPLATVGAILPGNVKIGKKEFLGKTSYGMFCSLKELGIYNDASKIYRFSLGTEIGKDVLELWELPDYIIELEITANRGDALSHLGVARDLSALFNININKEKANIKTVENELINNLSIEIKEPKACPRYTSRVVKNVKVEESPEWMKKSLYFMDSRPISNIVDITNYMMFNYGHPLHVFDYDLLEGHKIIVRYAKNGEKIEALNGETYDLNENVLVIADEKEPIAIAGVIGGSKKSINENTKNVVIECAYFDPVIIRRNRKEIGGLSGTPLFDKSNDVISFISKKTKGKLPIIGVGGISTPEQAVEKIKAGAHLIQLYTGIIYEGPGIVSKINKKLLNQEF
jgi:phenylalanyl-tRNA synthetase beta chain